MFNAAELALDALDRIDWSTRVSEIDDERIDRREPSDRSREVHVPKDRLAAMTFQMDAQRFTGPFLESLGKRSDQGFVKFRLVGPGQGHQQRTRFSFIER